MTATIYGKFLVIYEELYLLSLYVNICAFAYKHASL